MALYSHAGRLRALLSRFGAAFKAEADALLDQVGMLDQAERTCGVLAYGDLKRVELAMALANQPRLLLMDEPTAGMAPRERIELMALTARLARARNIAVLFTEHDMDVVFGQADRIIVLDRGQLDRRRHARRDPRQSRRARGLSRRACTDAFSQGPARLLRPRPYPARRLAARLRPARSWRCWAATAPANRRS